MNFCERELSPISVETGLACNKKMSSGMWCDSSPPLSPPLPPPLKYRENPIHRSSTSTVHPSKYIYYGKKVELEVVPKGGWGCRSFGRTTGDWSSLHYLRPSVRSPSHRPYGMNLRQPTTTNHGPPEIVHCN